MELFTITCTTCRARLKVRELAAIGQILACPKCDSMVQVAPPPGWQPPQGQPAEQPPGSADVRAASPDLSAGLGSTISLYATPKREKPRAAVRDTAISAASNKERGKSTVAAAVAISAAATGDAAAATRGAATTSDAAAVSAAPAPIDSMHAIIELCRQHWLIASLVPAASLAVVVGGWLIWGGSTSSQSSAESAPAVANLAAPEPDPSAADATPRDTHASNYQRWLPAQAVSIIRIPLGDLTRQPAVEGLLRRAIDTYDGADLYADVVDPLTSKLQVPKEKIRRLTWAATEVAGEPSSAAIPPGVVILELAEPLSQPQSLLEGCKPLELRLGGVVCHQPPVGNWAHPFALVDERTIVSGPLELLRELGQGNPSDNDSTNGDSPKLASAALSRAIELAGPDTADTGMQAILAVDLAAARRRAQTAALSLLNHWPQGRDDWRTVCDLPAAMLVRLALRDAVEFDVALVCDEPTSAEKVHASLDQLASAAASAIAGEREALSNRLVASAINSATADQLDLLYSVSVAALNARQVQTDDATVWLRARVVADPPALAEAAAAGAPAIKNRRLEIARTLDERNHQRLLTGLAGFEKAEGAWPTGAGGAALLPPENRLSWLATMLPYYDHIDWHRELNFGRPWNDAANRGVARRPLELVINPALATISAESGFPVTHYVGVSGLGADAGQLDAQDRRAGVFGFQRRVGQRSIGDGAANTIAVLGVSGRLGPWAAGGDATVRPLTKAPYVNGPDGFGSGQPDGMLAGMADGSARFLSKDVDPRVIEQLATINGGEPAAIDTLTPLAPEKIANTSPAVDGAKPMSAAATASKSPLPLAPPKAAAQAPSSTAGIDVEARLGEKLPAIRFAQTTLAELVDVLGQLASVEITLDPQALAEAQIQADELISIDLKDTTIRAVLETALAEYGLGYVVDRNQVLVTNALRQQATPVKVTYDVADLTGEGPDALARFAALVPRLIEPSSWRQAGGKGTCEIVGGQLMVEQNAAVQRQVLVLCETLRVARGRSPKSSRDEAQFALDTRFARARSRLEAPVSANFSRPTPLVEVLAYLRQTTGTQLLVDGPSLAAVGLSRQSKVTLVANKQPLSAALHAMLDPLKLAVRIIDARTLQITSRSALADRLELEFYFAADLLGKDQRVDALIERIKGQLAAASWNDAGAGGVVEFDAPSGCLLVLQTQDVQMRLEDLLETWRKER